MTSEEIKERRDGIRQAGLGLSAELSVGAPGAASGICFWLAEIAYQLAKRNEGEGCQ